MTRRQRLKLTLLYYVLCIALAAITILHKNTAAYDYDSVAEVILPEGLNHLLPNDLSDLEETRQMDAFIERFMKQWEIVGASLAIMKDGKLLYSKGYGWADREQGIKTEVSHIFRIASVSKLITATAAMKLVEEGLLRLEDKVFGEEGLLNDSVFLKITDKRIKNITVDQLLRHRAGFSIAAGDPLFTSLDVARRMGIAPPLDVNAMVRYAASSRLGRNPGSSNIYSNLGYVVLEKVIEKASGMKYETYVHEKILYPAGCFDMHIGKSYYADRFPNEVKYYEPWDAEPVKPFDGRDSLAPRSYGGSDIETLGAAGGWVASPTELLKFVTAIDPRNESPNILSTESIAYMTAYTKDTYPVGWMRVTERGDWSRSGSLAGTSALLKRQQDGYTWMFVTNTSSWTGSKFTSKIDIMMRQAIAKVKNWPERDMFLTKNTK